LICCRRSRPRNAQDDGYRSEVEVGKHARH
jgi:hypothetical protein